MFRGLFTPLCVSLNPPGVKSDQPGVRAEPSCVIFKPACVRFNPLCVEINPLPVGTHPLCVETYPLPVRTYPLPVRTYPLRVILFEIVFRKSDGKAALLPPFDGFAETFFETDQFFVTERFDGVAVVRLLVFNVGRAFGFVGRGHILFTRDVFEDFQKLVEADAFAVGAVHHLADASRRLRRLDVGVHDVRNVCEIPGSLAVAVNNRRLHAA